MNWKNILKQEKSILIGLLLLCCSQIGVVCMEDELDDDLNSRDIEPPFRSSGVGDRQSAFRRVLHDQLERLTHAELKKEEEPDSYKEAEERHHRNREEEEHHVEQKKRKYDDDHENHASHSEEAEEEERTYNPWTDSFQDIFDDGTYAYGYNLPNGVTRYERSFYSEKYKGRVVEGFYTQPRHFGKRVLYELRCYRSDYYNGYRPLGVQYLRRQPIVQRDTEPDVDCFDKH